MVLVVAAVLLVVFQVVPGGFGGGFLHLDHPRIPAKGSGLVPVLAAVLFGILVGGGRPAAAAAVQSMRGLSFRFLLARIAALLRVVGSVVFQLVQHLLAGPVFHGPETNPGKQEGTGRRDAEPGVPMDLALGGFGLAPVGRVNEDGSQHLQEAHQDAHKNARKAPAGLDLGGTIKGGSVQKHNDRQAKGGEQQAHGGVPVLPQDGPHVKLQLLVSVHGVFDGNPRDLGIDAAAADFLNGQAVVDNDFVLAPIIASSRGWIKVRQQANGSRRDIVGSHQQGFRQFHQTAIPNGGRGGPETRKEEQLAHQHLDDAVAGASACWI